MQSVGLQGLCFWENGFRNFTNNRIPVSKPGDVRGMKVRTMENDVHLAAWRAFGANPTPMAFAELFTALQQGTVDAEENSLGIIGANKFYEVQKYISLTQHVYTPYVIVMNLEKYNSLTAVQRAAIDKAAVESTKTQREASQRLEGNILDTVTAYGGTVVELTGDEKAAFQKLAANNRIFDLVKSKMIHPEYLDDMLAGK
jgi:tripartite ATP-independent transporter DctP family solute receptor